MLLLERCVIICDPPRLSLFRYGITVVGLTLFMLSPVLAFWTHCLCLWIFVPNISSSVNIPPPDWPPLQREKGKSERWGWAQWRRVVTAITKETLSLRASVLRDRNHSASLLSLTALLLTHTDAWEHCLFSAMYVLLLLGLPRFTSGIISWPHSHFSYDTCILSQFFMAK